MDTRKYLKTQLSNVQNSGLNASGSRFRNAAAGIANNYTGRQMWQNANGAAVAPQPAQNAAPSGGAQMQPTSAPYVLQISNASVGAISNFDIFGALQYLNTGIGTWSAGSWTYNNVTVSSLLANTSYQQLLGQSNTKPFGIGQTMMQKVSGSDGQLTTPINFNVSEANGETYAKPLIFVYNQFQNITTQTTNVMNYIIDGNAKLTMTVAASTVFQLFLYPYVQVDTTNSLVSSNVISTYANPGTNQQSVILK